MDPTQRCPWLPQSAAAGPGSLPSFAWALCSRLPSAIALSSTTPFSVWKEEGGGDPLDDPENVEYLRRLTEAIYQSRAVAASYNIAVLAVILVFAVLHWRETRSDARKWRSRLLDTSRNTALCSAGSTAARTADGDASPSPSSSSLSASSSVRGMATPTGAAKEDENSIVDLERLPLLTHNQTASGTRRLTWPRAGAAARTVSSWLARQPPPLPVVNKTLPSNGTSVFVAAWVALVVFFHFFLLPLRWDFFFIFADRAGFVFIVNLPLLYLLAAKNQPLRWLTGFSYEALNIFHRRVGELLCFEALVHFVGMLVWFFFLEADWLKATKTPREYFTHPLILLGIGAFSSYELIFFTSLATFRQRWYELFLASHIVLQVAALVFLWFHFYTSRPYVALSLVIFLVDRLVWRFGLKRVGMTADLNIFEDGETFLVSANWDIPPLSGFEGSARSSRWWQSPLFRQSSIVNGWRPTDHVFLSVPVLGRSHALQAHPFTIASAAPGVQSAASETETESPHAWLCLLVRAHDGFTADLLRYAQTHTRVDVKLDGPYGSYHALAMLRASHCAILVAGGSGIAVTFPLVWALLHDDDEARDTAQTDDDLDRYGDGKTRTRRGGAAGKSKQQRVHLLWVTNARSHRSWIPQQQLDELVERGLDLVVPEPSGEAGRPDVAGCVTSWIDNAAADGREVGVVASGPDGLNRTVRNVCADASGAGLPVRVAVEKFGW
ncbi:ferric reductase like transmembrane component-domain-containing protein [Lasiosphaeria miniovina]|uniref:Ferric reductase like transmembrane component-domain-containing protein n=1 Tax=Lasiosphaeria miniovina TaxID=1954250 RepID=A0AA40BGF8_9PEZI|nr:ferric reductase like transmembrane component-domain-containing protein [Lasiosphaeria miniovina]KAK0733772.1 ferric reductase like transmembrane component-domain-containing protein [Lasiosphaeria miniovina]